MTIVRKVGWSSINILKLGQKQSFLNFLILDHIVKKLKAWISEAVSFVVCFSFLEYFLSFEGVWFFCSKISNIKVQKLVWQDILFLLEDCTELLGRSIMHLDPWPRTSTYLTPTQGYIFSL